MFGDVTSANVVGYAKTQTRVAGLVYKAISFQGINATEAEFTLSQLDVSDTAFSGWDGDYIATIKPNGAQDKYYSYCPDEGDEGWYEADMFGEPDLDKPADNVALAMNKAIYVFCSSGEDVTMSGAVLAGDNELYCQPAKLTYTGNFNPAPITLGDLVIAGGSFSGWDGDYIATVKANGAQDKYYSYSPEDGEEGWYEADMFGEPDLDKPANDVQIDANQAILLFSGSGVTINIPSPIKKNN